MAKVLTIKSGKISLLWLNTLIKKNYNLRLSRLIEKKVRASYLFLKKKIKKGSVIYGVNTGYGSLCNTKIEDNLLSDLQRNLVISHAQGMGENISYEISKIALLLKIFTLLRGYSGVSPALIYNLIYMYNNSLIPVFKQMGSVGASGDLIPLATMSLPLLKKGKVWNEGREIPAEKLKKLPKYPKLEPKEGLSLVNGTELMSAILIKALFELNEIFPLIIVAQALSFSAYGCHKEVLSRDIHLLKNHWGQALWAKNLTALLSEVLYIPSKDVQDPYSFRCIPQICGPLLDTFKFCQQILEEEINGVSDNPIIIRKKIYSGGNFHGEYLAQAMDFLKIPIIKISISSERRIAHLLDGKRNLPSFLAPSPGIDSGFMAFHYLAASILNNMQASAFPSSVINIPTCQNQEDVVSMGPNAGFTLLNIIENSKKIFAIELSLALWAINLQKNIKISHSIKSLSKSIFPKPIKSDNDLINFSNHLENLIPELISECLKIFKKVVGEKFLPINCSSNSNLS